MVRQTSIEAYRTIQANGMLSGRRWEAYDILFEHGPLTSNEVFEYAKLHGNPNYRHNTNARMTELRDRGVAVEIGTKACGVTGHRAILWDVTANLPVTPLPKENPEPTRAQFAAASVELRSLQTIAAMNGRPFSAELLKVCEWIERKGSPKP